MGGWSKMFFSRFLKSLSRHVVSPWRRFDEFANSVDILLLIDGIIFKESVLFYKFFVFDSLFLILQKIN